MFNTSREAAWGCSYFQENEGGEALSGVVNWQIWSDFNKTSLAASIRMVQKPSILEIARPGAQNAE